MVAQIEAKKGSKKRKTVEEETLPPLSAFPQEVGLEMGSEDEGEEPDDSSDGEVDVFPEIDARSDTDDENFAADGASADEEEDEEDEEEDEGSDDLSDEAHHIFPQSKTIISDITGQPKRVYPEIEPDYDSDSSTEDVRKPLLRVSTCCIR